MISQAGIATPDADAQLTGQASSAPPKEYPQLATSAAGRRQVGAGALIHHLQRVIHGVLRPLLPPGPLCLVDYPNHANVGDSAIWLGEIAYLSRTLGVQPAYCCSRTSYSAAELKEAAPEGAILLHGGGNFGTLWPAYQEFRFELMERFPGRPIIQLPQSIHFSNESAVADAARAIRRHGAFTLLVRDHVSFEFARSHFDCPVHLCPDMAFWIGGTRRRAPNADLLCLLRTDKERKGEIHVPNHAGAIVMDWLEEVGSERRSAKLHAFARAILAGGSRAARREARYKAYALHRYRRGVRILSQGRVVISDRLHAHIISTLLDLPHVVLDNSYGKLGSFVTSWTSTLGSARCAGSMDEAIAQAHELLATSGADRPAPAVVPIG